MMPTYDQAYRSVMNSAILFAIAGTLFACIAIMIAVRLARTFKKESDEYGDELWFWVGIWGGIPSALLALCFFWVTADGVLNTSMRAHQTIWEMQVQMQNPAVRTRQQ